MPVAAALIPAGVSAGVGLYQTLFSGKRKAQRELEQAAAQTPMYGGNKGVDDYYREAYNRYMTSPENTAMYQNIMKNIGVSQANAVSNLQDRRAALDTAGQLEASGLSAAGSAFANAEQQRNQRFGVYGQAVGMKRADEMQQFNINRLMPYQNKLNLLSAKAAGAAQTQRAGLQNLSNAAMSAADTYAASQGYGTGRTRKVNIGNGGYYYNGQYIGE